MAYSIWLMSWLNHKGPAAHPQTPRSQSQMTWLNGITNSMDVNLNKTQVLLMDRKGWCAVHGVGKSRTGLNGWTHMECFLLPNVLRTLHKKHSETLMTSIGYSIPIPRKSMRGLRLCTLSSYSILSTQESAWHKQQLNKYWNKRILTGL